MRRTIDASSQHFKHQFLRPARRLVESLPLASDVRELVRTDGMTQQTDKYVNNLTIAVYGGTPEWLPIGLSGSTLLELDEEHDAQHWEQFGKSFGVIKLTGKEVLFVLDGQHRVMGFREAVKKDKTLLDQEIAVTLVAHENDAAGRKRTRRLFTTINRYAKPVSLGETILLDEDDVSAILARRTIVGHNHHRELCDMNVAQGARTA